MSTPVTRLPALRRQRASRRPREETRSARIGAWLARRRSWLPVPFIVLPLLAARHASPPQWLTGLALIGAGAALRIAGVAAAIAAMRQRSRTVERLVTWGVFAWTRNPLYLGNLLVWTGVAVASGSVWCVPVVAALHLLEYSFIVRWEESVLDASFGERYETYRRRTPRWLPRPPRAHLAGEHSWSAALASERTMVIGYILIVAALAIRQAI